MIEVAAALAAFTAVLRSVLLAGGIGLAALATADWAARTRRISPFSGVARLMRTRVDPRLAGVERQVLRVGGHPSATPWWALVAYVIVASLLVAGLDMFIGLIREALLATRLGGAGFIALLMHWMFAFLRFALLVRVLASWFPRWSGSKWVRWSFGATEWMVGPLRRVLPSIGMIDISPIVAYFALQIAEGLVSRLLFPGF